MRIISSTPISPKAVLTLSRLNGLMIVSIFFMCFL